MFRNLKIATLLTFLALVGWSPADQPTAPATKELPAGAYKYRGRTYLPTHLPWLTWSNEINGGSCPDNEPYAVNPTHQAVAFANGQYKWMDSQVHTSAKITENSGAADAFDEVNAYRAQRGLRPFVRDEGLSIAAGRGRGCPIYAVGWYAPLRRAGRFPAESGVVRVS